MNLQTIRTPISKLAKDVDGPTIVEYAVASVLISVALTSAFVLLGGPVDTRNRALC